MQDTAAVIIVAAGTSRRMQGRDKLWHLLAGRITLARTIDVFENSPCIDTIILVLHAERLADANTLRQHEAWQKIAAIVPVGSRPQASVSPGFPVLPHLPPPPHC